MNKMNNLNIKKSEKLGEGAYGIVYKGEIDNKGDILKVAVKRNFGDEENIGILSLREMSYLSLLNHPCVIKLKEVSKGDPFKSKNKDTGAMSPIPGGKRDNMIEDSHHFILEFSEGDLKDFYPKCDDYYLLKVVMCQILLGVEFIHSKGVNHRDLKPENILINIGDDNLPYAKIIDFGLSCHTSNYRPSTPGTVTYWYRAPEICCNYEHYTSSTDMWSLGCIFYEMFKKEPLISNKNDDSKEVFRKIINFLAEEISVVTLNEYTSKGKRGKFKHNYKSKNKKDVEKLLEAEIDVKSFNGCGGGTFKHLINIIKNLLVLEPEKRFTASECLDHEFFDIFRDFIKDMRKKYPPLRFEEVPKKIKIINCIERAWGVNILYKIYNNKNMFGVKDWYNNQIMFHSLRIFDEYLVYKYDKLNNEGKLRKKVEESIGKIHTKYDTELYINMCIYMTFKYFNVLNIMKTWDEIFPDYLVKEKNKKKVIEFEKLYIEKICKYQLYSESLIEYLDRDYQEMGEDEKMLNIRKYFLNYSDLEMDYEGTMEDLYLQIREGLKN